MKGKIEERPTETLTGIALAATIYGFLSQAGVPNGFAAVIAVIVAFLPALVSEIVDAVRQEKRAADAAVLEGNR